MTYLEGALEFMSPSTVHEEAKTIIARRVLHKLGGPAAGGVPDIAIEVMVSSSLVDKMAVYAGLGVPEVWLWRPESGAVQVHRLVDVDVDVVCEVRPLNEVVPTLDLAVLSCFVEPGEDQTALARAYLDALRRGAVDTDSAADPVNGLSPPPRAARRPPPS